MGGGARPAQNGMIRGRRFTTPATPRTLVSQGPWIENPGFSAREGFCAREWEHRGIRDAAAPPTSQPHERVHWAQGALEFQHRPEQRQYERHGGHERDRGLCRQGDLLKGSAERREVGRRAKDLSHGPYFNITAQRCARTPNIVWGSAKAFGFPPAQVMLGQAEAGQRNLAAAGASSTVCV